MYKYKEMIELAQSKGLADEKKIWKSVVSLEPILETFAEEHPEEYDEWIAKLHEILFGPHYDHELAQDALENITYTDKNGTKQIGPHWKLYEIIEATRGMSHPEGVTDYDKWVAYNVWYSDLSRELDDSTILKTANRFFFNDEDGPTGKIWKYMHSMHE